MPMARVGPSQYRDSVLVLVEVIDGILRLGLVESKHLDAFGVIGLLHLVPEVRACCWVRGVPVDSVALGGGCPRSTRIR